MESRPTYTIVDRAALALSGGLMLLGLGVLGVVEILAGQPYSPAAMTNDAGGSTEAQPERTGERVDEKVKKLVLVDCTVRLVWLLGHTSPSGRLQLTSFVRY
jgi:hypothetical protein